MGFRGVTAAVDESRALPGSIVVRRKGTERHKL